MEDEFSVGGEINSQLRTGNKEVNSKESKKRKEKKRKEKKRKEKRIERICLPQRRRELFRRHPSLSGWTREALSFHPMIQHH